MSEIYVRRLGPDDWECYRDVRLSALAESPRAFASTLEREQQFPERIWRDRLAGGCCAVAFRAYEPTQHGAQVSEPIGLAAGYAGEEGAQLVGMWVAPAARGSSAGDALIAEISGWAAEQGHLTLALWVVQGNERAERLYARHGFVRTGRANPVREGEPTIELEMIRLVPQAPAAGA